MSGKGIFKVMIVAGWLLSSAWFIRYEGFPHWFDDTLQGYRELSRHLPAIQDSWMKVMDGDMHVGYTNSTVEIEEVKGEEELVLNSLLLIRVAVPERGEVLRLSNEVRLRQGRELKSSTAAFSFQDYQGSMELSPTDDPEEFRMSVRFRDFVFHRNLRVPRQAVIASPMMDAGLRQVRPGRSLRIRTLDPFSPSGEMRTMVIRGVSSSREVPPEGGRPLEVTKVAVDLGEMSLHTWIDEYGRVVRQETPFGLMLVQSSPQEAMKIPIENQVDLLRLLNHTGFSAFMPTPGTL